MIYLGHIQKGIEVFDQPFPLPEGTRVIITLNVDPKPIDLQPVPSWGEVFKDFIGKAEGLPSDMARNHDHYIHGAPKK